ncbi:sulfur carrier protein ThiS [Chitinivibrio alkaliphilus]|uniref:Thiamine biosynthesis protein ThiS (ThiaminS) n=1 Tax=Chitinivibrio alkaliphilus ACht1 TaxID=1313304 RepID=U7DA17_9BACT|nr:sulfur carrier protein ThiS [Chitinivibrio alkaliphilus]ERP39254.1 thiamine biosynthesis protein ThiS (ThiaminS) [Chitinivibrio alkaliphilus ACht1]
MQCHINGTSVEVEPGTTLLSILTARELLPESVVIERNGTIVGRDRFDEVVVVDKDTIEILSFVGGG